MPDAPITRGVLLQRAIETDPGTLVAATHRVPYESGSLAFRPVVDRIRRRYGGSAATSHQSSTGLTHVGIGWTEPATYDYLAILLSAFLAPTITGSGAGADKTWSYQPSDSNADNLKRHSLEIGGTNFPEEERLSGCVGSALEISWDLTSDWSLSVEMMGVRNTQGAKAAGLALPSGLVAILGRLTRVYIDPSTFGSTSYGRCIEGTIRIENEVSERFGTGGTDYPNRLVVLGRTVTASLVAEYDTTALRAAWRAGTLQKLRVEAPGAALGSTAYNARFDIPGTWETSELGDDEGIVTLAHDLTAEYNTALGADIVATIVNSIAAVP